MQPAFATIPTRTEQQAMDWSLVLISQGIEAVIERGAEANAWQLIVHSPDYPRALHAIRQYRKENARHIWRQELPWTALIFDWRCLVPLIFFTVLFAVESFRHIPLSGAGRMHNDAVLSGEWWRVITAVTLHGDLAHLVANVTSGLLLLGLAMGAYGPGIAMFGSFLAGIGGNLAGLALYPRDHLGLGASGMVMGALGLLAAQWLVLLRHGLTPRQFAVRGALSGSLLLVLLGFSPKENVDVLAHVAGFASGFAIGGILALLPQRMRQSGWLDTTALLATVAMVGGAWWVATRAA